MSPQLFDLVEYRSDPATQVNKDAVLKLSIFLNGVENNSTITRGTSVAPLFFSNSVPAIRCWGVLTAISALGKLKGPQTVNLDTGLTDSIQEV